LLVSILTPYYTAEPRSPTASAELSTFLAALAAQPGPCEILLGVATPGRRDRLSTILAELAGQGYPHRVTVLHRGFDPDRQRPASRGQAINDAAGAARGELLLILHLDTRLPPGALDGLRAAHRAGYRCGAFPKRYTPRPPLLALQEGWLNGWPLRVAKRTVGTNAVWLHRRLWQPLPTGRLLEDFALSDRLRRERLHVAREPVSVDAGKYLRTGVLASMAINAAVIGLHRCFNVDPDRLADELYSRRALGVGTAAFWPRLARTALRMIRESLTD